MEASYPIKNGANPPNAGPSPPSPESPSTVCVMSTTAAPPGTTCCGMFEYAGFCFGRGCCPIQSATCCDDGASCCPPEYPVCDARAGTCRLSQDKPFGVNALTRTRATSTWTQRKAAMKGNFA